MLIEKKILFNFIVLTFSEVFKLLLWIYKYNNWTKLNLSLLIDDLSVLETSFILNCII